MHALCFMKSSLACFSNLRISLVRYNLQYESGSFRPDYLSAPGRFAPLNRYYIIIDEVFFDNFLVINYLLVVCKKIIIHSFWSTLIIYLLVVYKKNNNSFILVYFCQRSQAKLFLQNFQKPHKNSKKVVADLVIVTTVPLALI